MQSKLECYKKLLMKRKNYESLWSNLRLKKKRKSQRENYLLNKLKKLKKIYHIVKIDFKVNSKTWQSNYFSKLKLKY
jgi:hypothetical protein